MRHILTAALALAMPVASASAQPVGKAEDHYHFRPAGNGSSANPWLVILPGGGGLSVFDDDHFYFDVAQRWNEAGFDVLVLDYQAAAPLVPGTVQGNPGPMAATVVGDALEAARRNDWLDLQCPGLAMGFSMGGAGTLSLAANPPSGLAGAIAFYPGVFGQPEGYHAAVPLLVLQGDADELTPRATLDRFVAASADPARIKVVHYPGAHHGFDIPSLTTPQKLDGGPVSGTFLYQEDAAKAAQLEIVSFVQSVLPNHDAVAACGIEKEG